jgi:hypothetical protein
MQVSTVDKRDNVIIYNDLVADGNEKLTDASGGFFGPKSGSSFDFVFSSRTGPGEA